MGVIGMLPPGPLAVVGDVHGELDALDALIGHLRRTAPAPETLVFVGDLIDRGPDSPGVFRRVTELIDEGRALAVLGNHELNLLSGARREGNHWYWGEDEDMPQRLGRYPSVLADPDVRTWMNERMRGFPLALEREDLRVVHAAWDEESVQTLRSVGDALDFFLHQEARLEGALVRQGLHELVVQSRPLLADPDRRPKVPPGLAQAELIRQNGNPVRVLTSGMEVPVDRPFWSSGKWRVVERDRWWTRYQGPPVVVGHYWRRWGGAPQHASKGGADLWQEVPPAAFAGQVFCVDYSVGRRHLERARGARTFGRLAALRWGPPHELVFDDGERVPVAAPSA